MKESNDRAEAETYLKLSKKLSSQLVPPQAAGLGTGLGLSICSSIIHRLGGVIKAASEGQGKGATFTVSLLL